nr:hypothetical protein [Granulosicoccus sp.]
MTTQLAFEDVMDNTRIRIRMRNWSAIVLVVAITSACGDSSGVFSAASLDDARTTPWDTGGILTLTEANAAGGEILSVIEVSFDQNRARRDLAVGEWPWRHPDGTLYYLATCGRQTNYVAVLDVFGSSSSASPCSDTVPNDGYSPTKFTYIMASPDQRRMAMEVRWYDRDLNVHYDTVIFEDNSIIATYEGFYAPAWLDNETLVMPSGNG